LTPFTKKYIDNRKDYSLQASGLSIWVNRLNVNSFLDTAKTISPSETLFSKHLKSVSKCSFSDPVQLNSRRRINKHLEAINLNLPHQAFFSGYANYTKGYIKSDKKINLNNFLTIGFIVHRIFPKIPIVQKIYFFFTKGKNRRMSKAEILGRMYSCGFRIHELSENNGLLYFVAQKIKVPAFDLNPSFGPVFKMRRMGKYGKPIFVYKFRTMHPYSEYLQEYVYEKNQLKKGGKFKDDFRISSLGKVMRKYFLDEIPMLFNLLKGDIKLVGVRPLSEHYLSLYSDELKHLRHSAKPGLFPPYYADSPDSLNEIMVSETNYLNKYKKRPFYTDVNYFFKIVYTILIKKNRSS